MSEFLFRSEDIASDELFRLFVDSDYDRAIVERLKGRNPIVLVGSRGVGKSFLMRVACEELKRDFESERVLPVYLSFSKSALVGIGAPTRFMDWMLARIASAILRALANQGLLSDFPAARLLTGGVDVRAIATARTPLEVVAEQLEDAWRNGGTVRSTVGGGVISVDDVKDAVQQTCERVGMARVALFVDEAAHVLLPDQQRSFFTLFRDLRSAYLNCNAAVYPGTTSFGDVFEPSHDASFVHLVRDVVAPNYVATMRDIAVKQADSDTIASIQKNTRNFLVLACAASGNPRVLLKTLARSPKVSGPEVNEVFRTYYKTEVWAEHSSLCERYEGLRELIDWGRGFLEAHVLPGLKARNDGRAAQDGSSSAFVWVHRDVPEGVKEALRLLCYGGLLYEQSTGIKATRSEIGTRYLVNLGCLFSQESIPTATSPDIYFNLDVRRMLEFGANHQAFSGVADFLVALDQRAVGEALKTRLNASIDALDITGWQKGALRSLDIGTVGGVLRATEADLQRAYYVGEVRSRRMRNAAVAAVMEYLSG